MAEAEETPAQRVMNNPDLVKSILEYCVPVWERTRNGSQKVEDRFKNNILKQTSSVNRMFHEGTARVLFARISFQAYQRFHPTTAPTEEMSKTFAFYRSCIKTIVFNDSIHYLPDHLPIFLDSNHSVRFLQWELKSEAQFPYRVHIDLQKKTVRIQTTAILDGQDRVHIQTVLTKGEDDEYSGWRELAKVERWPRHFRIIRELGVKYSPTYQGRKDFDVKVQSLESILHSATESSPESSERGKDEVRIIMATAGFSRPDIRVFNYIKRILQHPSLRDISLPCSYPSEDLIHVLRKKELKYLRVGSHSCLYTSWSANRLFRFLQGFAESSIRELDIHIRMSEQSWRELRKMGSRSRYNIIDAHQRPQACIYHGWRHRVNRAHLQELRVVFPQWSWKLEQDDPWTARRRITMEIAFDT